MHTPKSTASVRILASVALVAVKVELGAAGAVDRLTEAATDLVPGDTVQRAVTLRNTGDQDLATLSLTASPATSSKLDTDAVKGCSWRSNPARRPGPRRAPRRTTATHAPGRPRRCS